MKKISRLDKSSPFLISVDMHLQRENEKKAISEDSVFEATFHEFLAKSGRKFAASGRNLAKNARKSMQEFQNCIPGGGSYQFRTELDNYGHRILILCNLQNSMEPVVFMPGCST